MSVLFFECVQYIKGFNVNLLFTVVQFNCLNIVRQCVVVAEASSTTLMCLYDGDRASTVRCCQSWSSSVILFVVSSPSRKNEAHRWHSRCWSTEAARWQLAVIRCSPTSCSDASNSWSCTFVLCICWRPAYSWHSAR